MHIVTSYSTMNNIIKFSLVFGAFIKQIQNNNNNSNNGFKMKVIKRLHTLLRAFICAYIIR